MYRNLGVATLLLGLLPAANALAADPPTPLWQLRPFDRLTLADDSVHDIEPVRISPDIEFEAAVDRPAVELDRDKSKKRVIVKEAQYIGILGLPSLDKLKGEVRGGWFRIRRQADGLDYYVSGRSIQSLSYYEDLLLRDANELLRSRRFDEAFPFLQTITERNPAWPGLTDARLRFHLQESEVLALQSKWARAFQSAVTALKVSEASPVEIQEAVATPILIREKLDTISRGWVEYSIVRQQLEQGRRVVAQLEQYHPTSSVAVKIRQDYENKVNGLLASMTQRWQAGDMVQARKLLEQANAWDPTLPQVHEHARRFYQEHPVLKVAVADTAKFNRGPADWSTADSRCADLVHLSLLQLAENDDSQPFRSPVIHTLTQSNINKRATVTLRDAIVWPDKKPVTSLDVLRLLVHSCRPESPLYHPGFARLVSGMEPEFPNSLQINFDRPQFRPAAWLQVPLIRMAGMERGRQFSTAHGLGPFRQALVSEEEVVYLANPLFLTNGQPVIKQIVERRIPDSAARLRAIEKREIDMVDFIPPRHLKKAGELSGVRVLRSSKPTVHVLQFDYNNSVLQDRTLRRAIDYAIDRNKVLETVSVAVNEQDRPITAPLPFGSFGYDVTIIPREPNPLVSRAVILGLRKKIGTLPRLTLTHTGNETSLAACQEIARQLMEVGLDIRVVDRDSDRFGKTGDLHYESYVVREPLYHLITLLTRENPTLMQFTSPWLRQQLVELQNVPHFTAAKALLPQLHRTLHDDVAVLPLWQWHDHFAVSDSVTNLAPEPSSVYESVGQWEVKPLFPPGYWKETGSPDATPTVSTTDGKTGGVN